MATIQVKAKPGRRVYIEGKTIPEDKFVSVVDTGFVRRWIDHWGDLEMQNAPPPPARAAKPAAAPLRPTAPRPETPASPVKPTTN